jgi:transposase
MSIRIIKERNGTHTVYLVKSIRTPGKKNPTSITLRCFGKLEKLQEEDPNIIKKLKEEYKINRASEYINVDLSEDVNLKLVYSNNLLDSYNIAKTNNDNPFLDISPLVDRSVFNIGYLILDKIFKELQLEEYFIKLGEQYKIQYNIVEAIKLHLYSRMLYPDSIVQTNKGKSRFYKPFDINLIESYRVLDILDENKSEICKYIFTKVNEITKRKIDKVIFDETNYYFSQEKPEGLKQNGVSKEHQVTPIIQFALMIDKEGLPITFDLFAGNTKDSLMFPPLMVVLKEKYEQKQVITFIADKGNNCSGNIIKIINNKDYYVFSQRVRGARAELAEWIISDDDYIYLGKDKEFKSKERIVDTTYNRQEKDEFGKYHIVETVTIKEKQVAFWSKNFADRDISKREKNIKCSEEAINNPGFFKMEEGRGRKRYVTVTSASDMIYELNTDKIDKEAKYDGYYAIITNNINLTKEEVIKQYRLEPKIEERFRITKSLFQTRPVFVYKPEHIQGHFVICYLSLVILTLLHNKVTSSIFKEMKKVTPQKKDLYTNELVDIIEDDVSFSFERILNAIRNLEVIKLSDEIYKFNTIDYDTVLLTKVMGILLTNKTFKKEMLDLKFK